MSATTDPSSRFVRASPGVVAELMLCALFGDLAGRDDSEIHTAGLADFQRDALLRVRHTVRRRGGVLLGDSVGLGKTHVAAALIAGACQRGEAVIVTAPSALEAHWKRHLRGVPRWRWLSHATLSRGGGGAATADVVVVDEAHAFRNPSTRRYTALAGLCAQARVLLITATPVNNSVLDLYHLLRLFARDDAFGDVGVPDLGAAFGRLGGVPDLDAIRRVARAAMVRRTRDAIRMQYENTEASGSGRARFPDRQPPRHVRYDLSRRYESLAGLLEHVQRLRFPAHGAAGDAAPCELMRLGLLKRLESSVAAFRGSLVRQRAIGRRFIDAAERGLLLDAAGRGDAGRTHDAAAQLSLDALVLREWPADRDRDLYIRRAVEDLERIDFMLRHSRASDPKLDALHDLIAGELASEKVLVFSEYRDTAVAIWQRLLPLGGVALVHGSDARLGAGPASRRAVIDRFAPLSNRARTPAPRERVRVLVATDVLAEGLNLQDARVVISFDVPWNPVRLAQRVGRIDRLGSPHAAVAQYVFMPDRGVDAWLGLVRTVRRKLRDIRTVGGDTHSASSQRPTDVLTAASASEDAWRALAHRLHRGLTGNPACAASSGAAPVASRVTWAGAAEAALVCVERDGAASLVLVRPDGSASIGCEEGLGLLVRALDGREAGDAGGRPPQELAAAAVGALSRGNTAPGTGRAGRAAARLVHRWIADRPGGATDAECATADRILRLVSTPLGAAEEASLGRALRTHGGGEDRVTALFAFAAGQREDGARGPGRPRVLAVLEIVPEAVDRPPAPD